MLFVITDNNILLKVTLNITILYIKSDTLLKLVLNTKKSGHHVIRYN